MKIDRDTLRVVGILGVVLGFLSGMFVEHTNKVIVPGQDLITALLVISAFMLLCLGILVFSELS